MNGFTHSSQLKIGPKSAPTESLYLCTAGINRLNTAVRAVLEQPCLTGGRTGTVRPVVGQALSDRSTCRRVGQACPISSWTGCTGPAGTGRTNLSDQLALASVGQCPSKHRSNTAVRAPLEQPCSTG
ncbi:hypothetical protein PCANC_25019 [Puccinia coronata f. sp. avenae]|uniref:Uncharacterized protein n=1 Tax=Puccinia coronata f. sp. avenae TaxID=200324 RepID=A0A2N5S935_9BASI|nr:hypothetical protein PCANC_25019 [Puccinia coronata f. sp. avenae]